MSIRVAYLAEGKLYLKSGELAPRLLESAFAQQILDRAQQNRERNEWRNKTDGTNPMRISLWGRQTPMPAEVRNIAMTGLSRAAKPDHLVYALHTGAVGGVFIYDIPNDWEIRLFHKQEFMARDLSHHPSEQLIALSLPGEDGTAAIAVMEPGGKGLRRLTEGDVLDEASTWAPDAARKQIVYQSAGIARDARGFRSATGPYSIQKLDLDNASHQVILEDPKFDYLIPKYAADGSLYVIRRPYRNEGYRGFSLKTLLLDIVMFPWRLLRAIFYFLNFMSVVFSGKPLTTAGGPDYKLDNKYMMLYGKVIHAEKAMNAAAKGKAVSLVPANWELLKITSQGDQVVVAKNVLAFDLSPTGAIVYTNGSEVFSLTADGQSQTLCAQRLIERVLAL